MGITILCRDVEVLGLGLALNNRPPSPKSELFLWCMRALVRFRGREDEVKCSDFGERMWSLGGVLVSGHMACPHRKTGPGVQKVQKTLRSSGLCA